MYIKVKQLIEKAAYSLLQWLESNDYSSFDHYDYWSTAPAIFGKRLFTWNKLLGAPVIAPVFLLDAYLPGTRRLFAKKRRSAEAIPRIAAGYFRLYRMTGDLVYLEKGCQLLAWLKNNASKTLNGIGWGLHFDWQGREFVPKGTPCVTLTAYSTHAFLESYRLTGISDYLQTVLETRDFVIYDLNRKNSADQLALSYTPMDHNYVINANSYAARILAETSTEVNDSSTNDMVEKIVNYIISQQNIDGSWYYSDKDNVLPKRNFIDSFHTCFVLENLFHIWKRNNDKRLLNSISRGFEFFMDNFLNSNGNVRYYYRYPCPTGIDVDIRGCAEAILCCACLSEVFPQALDMSLKITRWTIENMRDKDGFYYFRIYKTHKHKYPYVRWAQAPMFNALTFLMTKLKMKEVSHDRYPAYISTLPIEL